MKVTGNISEAFARIRDAVDKAEKALKDKDGGVAPQSGGGGGTNPTEPGKPPKPGSN